MDYKIKYTKESISELNKAFTFYRSKELDLGQRFKKSFQKIKLELKENPKLFKQVENNHRRAILSSSFPFTVHYLVNEKTRIVKIIGVFHQSRNLELVKEKIKIRKIHELKHEMKMKNRMKELEKTRKRKELEKGKGIDRSRFRSR
ncbi:type II toxin-antitoxin system RelE/ParE family toxin [Polaribacter porphyrae]|uniref:Plasmid stabilization protein n=1 Tax=Polaribacter porphyrae TaxID=1137780 RepID=A0A2S7WRQ1_9FLAO|nr:type II toxin-antitoxin system RelE/ParE family toxin [Polaribacter porphyrae]PQJ80277.1 hypothetical protein BTO18_14295 [Polaribacter porphyrae]